MSDREEDVIVTLPICVPRASYEDGWRAGFRRGLERLIERMPFDHETIMEAEALIRSLETVIPEPDPQVRLDAIERTAAELRNEIEDAAWSDAAWCALADLLWPGDEEEAEEVTTVRTPA